MKRYTFENITALTNESIAVAEREHRAYCTTRILGTVESDEGSQEIEVLLTMLRGEKKWEIDRWEITDL